jgi:hypothetical protein
LSLPVDPKTLPHDPETLQKIVVDLTAQLDRTERLLPQLLEAKTGRKSEQLSREQLALFAAELGMKVPEAEGAADDSDPDDPPQNIAASGPAPGKRCPARGGACVGRTGSEQVARTKLAPIAFGRTVRGEGRRGGVNGRSATPGY